MKRAEKIFLENIEQLEGRRQRKLEHEAETLERLAKRAGMPPDIAANMAMNLRPSPKADWIFVMISPQQNADVVQWLRKNSKRPLKSMELWAELLTCLRMDTGEILRSRADLAEKIKDSPQNISRIMTELASINAIRREKQGRSVRYFLNPNIATHIPTVEKRKQAQEGAGPLLTLMEGGQPHI